jgi:hypothetical protein
VPRCCCGSGPGAHLPRRPCNQCSPPRRRTRRRTWRSSWCRRQMRRSGLTAPSHPNSSNQRLRALHHSTETKQQSRPRRSPARTPRRTHTPSCPPSQRRSQDSCCNCPRPAPPCTCLSPHNSHTRAVRATSAATMPTPGKAHVHAHAAMSIGSAPFQHHAQASQQSPDLIQAPCASSLSCAAIPASQAVQLPAPGAALYLPVPPQPDVRP